MTFQIGNQDGSPFDSTMAIVVAASENKIVINKNVSLRASLSVANDFAYVIVNGVFKEFGYGNPFTNSYVDVEELDAYLNARFDDWSTSNLTTDQKERLIISGTDFVERNFDFKYYKLRSNQGLSFPRSVSQLLTLDSSRNERIPQVIKNATMEASYLRFKSQSNPLSQASADENVVEIKSKVGPLEETKKYSSSGNISSDSPASDSFKYIANLLKDYVQNNSTSIVSQFEVEY